MNGLEAFKEIRENTTLTEVEFYFESFHAEVEIVALMFILLPFDYFGDFAITGALRGWDR